MSDAKTAYEATAVGATGTMRIDAARGETVEWFQSVADSAEQMARLGLIRIKEVKKESMTGQRLITAIMFERLE